MIGIECSFCHESKQTGLVLIRHNGHVRNICLSCRRTLGIRPCIRCWSTCKYTETTCDTCKPKVVWEALQA